MEDWAGDRDISRGILTISTPRQGQGQEKGLQLEQGVEAMLVLLQATSYLLNADSRKSPSTGHSTSSVLFPIPPYERGLRVQ